MTTRSRTRNHTQEKKQKHETPTAIRGKDNNPSSPNTQIISVGVLSENQTLLCRELKKVYENWERAGGSGRTEKEDSNPSMLFLQLNAQAQTHNLYALTLRNARSFPEPYWHLERLLPGEEPDRKLRLDFWAASHKFYGKDIAAPIIKQNGEEERPIGKKRRSKELSTEREQRKKRKQRKQRKQTSDYFCEKAIPFLKALKRHRFRACAASSRESLRNACLHRQLRILLCEM